jgi:hypothetical protein
LETSLGTIAGAGQHTLQTIDGDGLIVTSDVGGSPCFTYNGSGPDCMNPFSAPATQGGVLNITC